MPKEDNIQNQEPQNFRRPILWVGLLILGGLIIWGITNNLGALLDKNSSLPIDMHSSTQADYSQDQDFYQFPPVDIQLVIDAIWDENLDAANLGVRLTQVNNNFIASAASVTPQPTLTITADPGISATEGSTPVIPTLDLTPSISPTITPEGFVASPTSNIPSVTPTATSMAATDTPLPPTNTSLPPTNTLPPAACSQLSLAFLSSPNLIAKWKITNDSSTSFTITSIHISWPSANQDLETIYLAGLTIWEGTKSPPSATINSTWQGGVSRRTISGTSNAILELEFNQTSQSSGYSLTVDFSDGCSKTNHR